MILLKTLHPNRWFLYFIAIAFAVLLIVYYAAQTYLIDEDTRYIEQPVGITNTTPAQNAGDVVDTSSWKTYRNEKYGFEFKYPPDYEVTDSSNDIVIGEPNFLLEFRVHRTGTSNLGVEYRSKYYGYNMLVYPISERDRIRDGTKQAVYKNQEEWGHKPESKHVPGDPQEFHNGQMQGVLYTLNSGLVGPYYDGYVIGGQYIFTISTYNPEENLKQILETFHFWSL